MIQSPATISGPANRRRRTPNLHHETDATLLDIASLPSPTPLPLAPPSSSGERVRIVGLVSIRCNMIRDRGNTIARFAE
jgi:hypothetical protein